MSAYAKAKQRLLWIVAVMSFAALTLLFYNEAVLKGFSPCRILKTKLSSAIVQSYSDTQRELDLLEPVALAVLRKKVHNLVEKRSQVDCAITLYSLWHGSTNADPESRRNEHDEPSSPL